MARKSKYVSVLNGTDESASVYRCGIYCRLSDEDGDNTEYNSIGNQEKIAMHFLKAHPDIEAVDIYSDNGFTGMNFSRPGFRRMLSDIRDGVINCVIVKDISRLGRHFVLTSELAEKILPEMNVRLISINDGYDSIKKDADLSSLTLPLKMVMNDYYVKDISKKIKASIGTKMKNGDFLPASGSIPYGYLRNSEKTTFDIDTETAPTVKRIFEMRAAGISINAICKELNKDGIFSPGKLRYERKMTDNPKFANALWSRKTVRKILSDPVYLGNRIHGKIGRERVGLDKSPRPDSEWITVKNAHPAIISDELFEKVRNIISEEKESRNMHDAATEIGWDSRDIFRNKIFCADCGSVMIGMKGCARKGGKAKSWIYYDCNSYRESQRLLCSCHYINQNTVMSVLKNALDKQLQIAVNAERLISDITAHRITLPFYTDAEKKQKELAAQRKNLELKTEQLLLDLTDGLIDREEYMLMKKRYSNMRTELSAEEKNAAEKIKEFKNTVEKAESRLKALRNYNGLSELDRETVDLLVNKIYVSGDGNIKIVLNFEDPCRQLKKYIEKAG